MAINETPDYSEKDLLQINSLLIHYYFTIIGLKTKICLTNSLWNLLKIHKLVAILKAQ